MTLEDQFKRAVEVIQSLPKGAPVKVSQADQLKVYSLYKQATVGDINTQRPGIFDQVGRWKWDAWNKLKGTSADDAKKQYVETFFKVFEPFKGTYSCSHRRRRVLQVHRRGQERRVRCLSRAETPLIPGIYVYMYVGSIPVELRVQLIECDRRLGRVGRTARRLSRRQFLLKGDRRRLISTMINLAPILRAWCSLFHAFVADHAASEHAPTSGPHGRPRPRPAA